MPKLKNNDRLIQEYAVPVSRVVPEVARVFRVILENFKRLEREITTQQTRQAGVPTEGIPASTGRGSPVGGGRRGRNITDRRETTPVTRTTVVVERGTTPTPVDPTQPTTTNIPWSSEF